MPAEIHRLAVHFGSLGHEGPGVLLAALAEEPPRGLGQQQPHRDLGSGWRCPAHLQQQHGEGHHPLQGHVVPDEVGDYSENSLTYSVGNLDDVSHQVFVGYPG